MIPRFGRPPRPGQSYRLRPGAYAILLREGRMLLTHQAQPVPEYQLPGGGIDAGEGGIAALHREVIEETGWTIASLRAVGSYRRFCYMPEQDMMAEKLCMIWVGRPVLRLAAPSEPGHRACWVTPGAALALLADPGARHWTRRVLGMSPQRA